MQDVSRVLALHHPVMRMCMQRCEHPLLSLGVGLHGTMNLSAECRRQTGKAQDQHTFGFEGLEAAVPF